MNKEEKKKRGQGGKRGKVEKGEKGEKREKGENEEKGEKDEKGEMTLFEAQQRLKKRKENDKKKQQVSSGKAIDPSLVLPDHVLDAMSELLAQIDDRLERWAASSPVSSFGSPGAHGA